MRIREVIILKDVLGSPLPWETTSESVADTLSAHAKHSSSVSILLCIFNPSLFADLAKRPDVFHQKCWKKLSMTHR